MAFGRQPDVVATAIGPVVLELKDWPAGSPHGDTARVSVTVVFNDGSRRTIQANLLDHASDLPAGTLQSLRALMDAIRALAETQILPEGA